MSALRSLPVLVAGALLGAIFVIHPAPGEVDPPPVIGNYRLMHSGPPVKS